MIGICKEYPPNNSALEKVVWAFSEDYYRVRVKLISEKLGVEYADGEFDLQITKGPFSVELTPHVELSKDQIRQRLERFLSEGNGLLRDFPKQTEQTDDDVKKIDAFEGEVVKFLKRVPDRFSVATFLSDVPVEQFTGGAHRWNWPSLNRLTTRLARIRDMVDEVRKT